MVVSRYGSKAVPCDLIQVFIVQSTRFDRHGIFIHPSDTHRQFTLLSLGLLELDQRAVKVLGVGEYDRLAMRADLRRSIAQNTNSNLHQLL